MPFAAYILLLVQAEYESLASATAWARFRKDLGIETACLFWTVSEVGILLAVTVLCRVLRETPLPNRVTLIKRERWMVSAAAFLVVLIVAGVYGRYFIWHPLPIAMDAANTMDRGEVPDAIHALVINRAVTHYLIWGANLFAWVVLESAIVVQGIRAYRTLATLTGSKPMRPAPLIVSGILVGIGACLATTNAGADIIQAMENPVRIGYAEALDDLHVVNRFAEFIVRVVGVVWVTVEWVAAIYLIRGVAMLGRFFRERRHVA